MLLSNKTHVTRGIMFQDSLQDNLVSFPSTWRKEKSKSETATQTSEILTYEASCQSRDQSDIEVQTDEEKREEHHHYIVDNSAELREFLRRVEPMIMKALDRNVKTHAFDGYKAEWEDETTGTSVIHTLQYSPFKDYQCTSLSWNTTGSVIAVSYGKFNHDDWCSHKSAVCTWNIDRRSIDPNKPDVIIELPVCIMSLAFHPSLPAILAVGAFDGGLHILNTGNENDPIISSSSGMGHKEPIAQLKWILREEEGPYRGDHCLLSLGNDGMIFVWDWDSQGRVVGAAPESKLVPSQGLSLRSANIPNNLSIAKSNAELGGTCLSFSCEDKSVFVVGCENGSLIKCSLDDLSSVSGDCDLSSSMRYAFKPHSGPVYSLSSSPFHRNIFLSCGLDTTLRLYSLLESSPLLTIEPGRGYLFAVCWSPTCPVLISLGTSHGELLLYNIATSHITPQASIQISDQRAPIYSIEYNIKQPKLVAVGDGCGVVKVVRLSSEYTQQSDGQMEFLSSLAKETLGFMI